MWSAPKQPGKPSQLLKKRYPPNDNQDHTLLNTTRGPPHKSLRKGNRSRMRESFHPLGSRPRSVCFPLNSNQGKNPFRTNLFRPKDNLHIKSLYRLRDQEQRNQGALYPTDTPRSRLKLLLVKGRRVRRNYNITQHHRPEVQCGRRVPIRKRDQFLPLRQRHRNQNLIVSANTLQLI